MRQLISLLENLFPILYSTSHNFLWNSWTCILILHVDLCERYDWDKNYLEVEIVSIVDRWLLQRCYNGYPWWQIPIISRTFIRNWGQGSPGVTPDSRVWSCWPGGWPWDSSTSTRLQQVREGRGGGKLTTQRGSKNLQIKLDFVVNM